MKKSERSRFYYGWIVAIASFLTTFILLGSIQYNFSVLSKPLLEEFGWTRTLTSGAYSLYMIVHGLSSILMGRLSDRYGPRITIGANGFLAGLGMVLCSQIGHLWQLYVFFGLLIGLASGAAFSPTMATTTKWFSKRKGLALGVVSSGIGVGTLVMSPTVNTLISVYGWQRACLITGLVAWAILLPVALVIKPGAVVEKTTTYVENEKKSGNANDGWDLSGAMKTRGFWSIFFANLLWLVCLQMVLVHIYYYAVDLGASLITAASILSLIGGCSVLGRLMMGAAADRFGTKRAWLFCFACQIAMMFWLTVWKSVWALYVFAPFFGFSYGGTVPLHAAMAGDFFGTKNLGAIIGFLTGFPPTIGGTLGPFLGGYIFDLTGSYYFAFILGVTVIVMATVSAILAKKPERA